MADWRNWVRDWAVIPTQGRFAGDEANDLLGNGLEVVGIGIAAVQGLFPIFDGLGLWLYCYSPALSPIYIPIPYSSSCLCI
jgi:hypothetical protein